VNGACGMNTTTQKRREEKNETEQSKNRDSTISQRGAKSNCVKNFIYLNLLAFLSAVGYKNQALLNPT